MTQPGENADPIGDHAHSPVAGIVHRYPDRVLFKLVHVCAVYCRFCFRREMVGPGKATSLSARPTRRARLYPRASGNLGSDPDRRRSPDAVAAPARRDHGGSRRDRPCQDHPHSYPRAGRRSRAHQRRDGCGPEGQGRHHLGCTACQPCPGIDRRRAPPARGLIDAGIPMVSQSVLLRGVNDDAATLEALMRGLRRMPDQALLPASRRSRARHRASAHDAGAGAGIDARPAGAGVRTVPAGLRARYSRRPWQGAGRPELSVAGKFFLRGKVNRLRNCAIVLSIIAATFISILPMS